MKKKIFALTLSLLMIMTLFIGIGSVSISATQNGDWEYTEQGTTFVMITSYLGSDSVVTIPSSIDGLPVYYIGSNAFYNNAKITNVVIPFGVRWIQEYAFNSCTSLKNINLPSSITSIDSYAFSSCTSLTSIIIPNGVTRIEEYTFSYCTSLTSITIPTCVRDIAANAFEGCLFPVIYGSSDSYAENYAKSKFIPFKAINNTVITTKNGGTVTNKTTTKKTTKTRNTTKARNTTNNNDLTTVVSKSSATAIVAFPQNHKMIKGNSLVLEPQPTGGIWEWDKTFFSATFNSPATFTALKTGESTITYTVNGVSQKMVVTIQKPADPKSSKSGIFIIVIGFILAIAIIEGVFLWRKKNIKTNIDKMP